MMERFARFTLKHNRLIISMIILLDFIALYFVFTRFAISGDILSFFRTGFKESEEFKTISEKYKGLNVILIGMKKADITSRENLKHAYKFLDDLQKIKGIDYINSFAPIRILKGMSFLNVNYENVNKLYPDIIASMKKNNTSLYKKDLGMVTVQLGNGIDSNKVIEEIIKTTKRYDFEFHYSGSKIMEYYVNKYLLLIIFLIIPVVIFLVLFVFKLSLKSSKAMGLSIIPAGFAALWTFAYIFISGTSLNLLTIVTPLFVIVMGSADALHFVSHYIENRKKFIEKDKAIVESMKMVGIPMLMTTGTTMVGFLSLEVSSIPAVRQMGYFAAVGIAFAGLISWTFIPSVLKLTDLNVKENRKAQHMNFITFFPKAYKRPKTVIISFTFIAVFFAAFIPRLRVRTDQLLFFKNYTNIVKDAHFFKKNFGYSNIAIADYRTDLTNALYNDMVKNKVLEFEKRLKNIDGVVNVISYFDIANKISKKLNNELLTKLVLYRMIKENIIPIDQWIYKNKDFKIILQLNSGNSDILQRIRGVCKNYNNVTFTGPDYLFYVLNSKIVHDQVSSLSLAVILVFLLLLLFYKNVRYALKGIIPILFTLVVFFGFLEISRFNLNIVIANIASIAIGVGIDYSIHFIGSYAYHKGDIDAAIRSVSIPILANALGLSIGLSGLMLSPMRVHFYISCCMWVTMLTSSFSAMLLLPILFRKSRDII